MTFMPKSEEIINAARERAQTAGAAYAGSVRPAEAQALAADLPGARIVDVRSRAELDFVGRIPGALEIEWKTWPGMQLNPGFMAELQRQAPKDTPLLFICRSGARSHEAAQAAAAAGYTAYNILEGFEGDRDSAGHRNTVSGWRAAGLPWVQS